MVQVLFLLLWIERVNKYAVFAHFVGHGIKHPLAKSGVFFEDTFLRNDFRTTLSRHDALKGC